MSFNQNHHQSSSTSNIFTNPNSSSSSSTSSSNLNNRASLPVDFNKLNRLNPTVLINQNRKTKASSIYNRPISLSSVSSSSSLISSSSSIASNTTLTKPFDQSSLSSSPSNQSNSLTTHVYHPTLSQFEVNLVCFEHLFSEMVRYTQQRVDGIGEFEKKLNILGYQVGYKLLSLLSLRDSLNGSVNTLKSMSTLKSNASNLGGGLGGIGGSGNDLNQSLPIRLTRLVPVLSWIHSTLWKTIVGKTADILEHSNENEDEYMISDNDLLITRSINVPKEMNQLSCGAYMAGIVEGSLDGLGFPARVTSHFAPSTQFPRRTTLLIKFEKVSIDRENSFKIPLNS